MSITDHIKPESVARDGDLKVTLEMVRDGRVWKDVFYLSDVELEQAVNPVRLVGRITEERFMDLKAVMHKYHQLYNPPERKKPCL